MQMQLFDWKLWKGVAEALFSVFLLLLISPAEAQLLTGYSIPSAFSVSSPVPEDESMPLAPKARGRLLTGYGRAEEVEIAVEQKKTTENDEVITEDATSCLPRGPHVVAAQSSSPPVSAPRTQDEEAPVDLSADSLEHDKDGQTITARGHVELVQAGRILRAQEVRYNMATDTVTAHGDVVLNEPNGDVHFAENVQLNNKMNEGLVAGLRSYLSDGGQFTAVEGQREGEDGRRIVMRDATYTPCDCDTGEDGDPVWQIRASKVTYDKESHRVAYKNARFEIFGVPVLYTPYLAHPDGQEERKSGFLSPTLEFDSTLGTVVTEQYYWDIAPNRDATFGVMAMTQEAPVALAEYRHRFKDAELKLNGSGTYSSRVDEVDGVSVRRKEAWRGHLRADGRWDINEKWRAGAKVALTSDDQYLRQYDFSGKDVLENELSLERFSGRHYAVGRLLSFQDVRVREERTDQPNVLPELEASFVGKPNALIGGRWDTKLSVLNLQRGGQDQDMERLSAQVGWRRRHAAKVGLVSTMDLQAHGDTYYVHDRSDAAAGSGTSRETRETRGFVRAHMVSSYPVMRDFEKMQAVIEPVAALTATSDIKEESSTVPNEDSQDVQLDPMNLFNPDRFPGYDKIEDRSRVTYGLRSGLYGHKGSYAETFIGQSHRFENKDNPFPEGSGLSTQESDIVGQVAAAYRNDYGMNYRFQIDSVDTTSQRHEFDGFAKWDPVSLSARYLFAKALQGTDISENREQLKGTARIKLIRNWSLRSGALYDLGEDPGLRKAMAGIDYLGCCMTFSLGAERSLTTDSSGDSGLDVTLRLGLKHIGAFETSGGSWGAGN